MSDQNYKRFSFKAAIELAAPPTWAAAIMSVLVGGAAAIALSPREALFVDAASRGEWLAAGTGVQIPLFLDGRAILVWVLMLITAILMQSAVNTLNDYKDFLSGTDSAETVLDENDASIVYNNIDPKAALYFTIVLLACALATGLVVVWLSGWPLLIIGCAAALMVVLYSVGPRPISFLPLGELVSGITMGGFITISTYYAMTLSASIYAVAITLPPVITIGLIMLTNNICDIERDEEAGRKTLAVILGRDSSIRLGQMLAWACVAFMVLFVVVLDIIIWRSMIVLGFATAFAVVLYFLLRKRIGLISSSSYKPRMRKHRMGNIVGLCYICNALWIIMLLGAWGLGEILETI